MTTVLVKLGNVSAYEYELNMEIVGIYPSDKNICSPIDFENETIVVTATIGMLSGCALEELKSAAKECYISALQGYIKERWDVISAEDRLRIINFIPLPEVLSPTMDSNEMMSKMEQVSRDDRELYINLVNTYEYTPD
jgi:hypothetical protein